MAARPIRVEQGIAKPDKGRSFQTEQDWLNARQVEINERGLKTVQSVESVRAEIRRKVEALPARQERKKYKEEDRPKKRFKKN
jgi:hypothetical protein